MAGFLKRKSTIIWAVLAYAFARFLVAFQVSSEESRYLISTTGAGLVFLALLSYLFYKNNTVAKWLFMVYVGFLGAGGIGLFVIMVAVGDNGYMLPLSLIIGSYFLYATVCIYRYY